MISGPIDPKPIASIDRLLANDLSKDPPRLVVGASYLGQVLSRLDEQTVAVSLDGNVFAMRLGQEASPGQTLSFKYLSSEPNPSFLLLKPTAVPMEQLDRVAISGTGVLITQYVHESDAHLALSKIDAAGLVNMPLANMPANPKITAHDLKQAITLSGLFYEAHLADFVQGKRPVDLILQEPQNKTQFDPSQVISKQLDILEHQSLQWSGSIWPGQVMHWTIAADNAEKSQPELNSPHSQGLADDVGIISTLELDFPNLQKVVANFNIKNGALKIQLEASSPKAQILLQSELRDLMSALQDSGQHLESILVKSHE